MTSLFFLKAVAAGSLRIPIDHFYTRYKSSSDIVLGRVVSLKSQALSVGEFSGLSSQDTVNATIQIIKSWKGAQSGKLDFLFNGERVPHSDLNLTKKTLFQLQVGQEVLLFLRTIDGKRYAEYFFGAVPVNSENTKHSNSDYVALESIAAGKSLDEAIKPLGEREYLFFKKQRGEDLK
ncbi:MAG: hypothetical protein ACXVCK_07630 [Bdellovibrionota bacterium]